MALVEGHVKRYQIIYADPPWDYPGGEIYDRGGAKRHYDTMSCEEIARLPVINIRAWDSALFLWTTFPRLEESFYVLRQWGFDYKGVAFVWVKTNKKQNTPYFGMGKWTRQNAEICLFGMHGSMERKDASVSSVIMRPVMGHSQKPPEVREKITQLLGDLPRIELFARPMSPLFPTPDGWDVWGNEIACSIDLGSCHNNGVKPTFNGADENCTFN